MRSKSVKFILEKSNNFFENDRRAHMERYFEKVYKKGYIAFVNEVEKRVTCNEKSFIITANPETLMIGTEIQEFDKILKSEHTVIVPDGIGVVKAATILGYHVKGRVTGVELVGDLLKILNEQKKTLYLLGAQEEVLGQFVCKIKSEYPNIKIGGYQNGYVQDKDAVFEEIAEIQPDVVLVALGIPQQELLIYKHYDKFQKGIFIGVGGAFDVLSGVKKRAPAIFIKLSLEWLYRIIAEPKRLKRFYKSNIKFISKVKEMRDKK